MEVRQARVGDAAGIAAVQVASWQQAHRGLMPAELLDSLSVPVRTQRLALGRTGSTSATAGPRALRCS